MTVATSLPILSVDDAIARHPNEWIFMQVTAEDEYHAPSHGMILAHDPRRGTIQRRMIKTIAGRADRSVQYYLFQAYPRNRSFEEVIDALDERSLDRIERALLREEAG